MKMRWISVRISCCLLCCLPLLALAQADPVQWNTSIKKINANTYEIHLTATVKSPWHLYSQATPAGGPVPTVISFAKNPVLAFDGNVLEKGDLVKKREEVFGIDVMYFNNTVDFVQVVKTKAKVKTNVTGSVRYMVCNDRECLPPKTVSFELQVP